MDDMEREALRRAQQMRSAFPPSLNVHKKPDSQLGQKPKPEKEPLTENNFPHENSQPPLSIPLVLNSPVSENEPINENASVMPNENNSSHNIPQSENSKNENSQQENPQNEYSHSKNIQDTTGKRVSSDNVVKNNTQKESKIPKIEKSETKQNNNPEYHTPNRVNTQNEDEKGGKDIFDFLMKDKEATLILLLIFFLYDDDTDPMLLMALVYLLI